MKPLVTVLVCAYNDEGTIEAVLQGLMRLTYRPLEILVVNDASTDRTGEIISRFDVTALTNERNRGLGFNLNLGLKRARGEYLAVVQSDCEVTEPDWLDRLMELMGSDVGVVVSQREIHDFASLPAGARYFNAVAPQDLLNRSGEAEEQLYCRGKADLYRVPLLRELGGWNPAFFTAGEDTDLSIRIRRHGYRILLHPSAKIRYLFSGRQASVPGAFRKAILYGRTAFLLYHLHGYDGIQARTYLATIMAAAALPLPLFARLFAGIAVGVYSFSCRIQMRRGLQSTAERAVSLGFVAVIASVIWTVLHFTIKFPGIASIPAAAVAAAGFAYTAYLAAKNTGRNYRKGERISRLPHCFLFCFVWRLLSGIGYLSGALVTRDRNHAAPVEMHESTSDQSP